MSTSPTSKMKVEIWSDIMCPFCYIGKRHLEAALAEFPEADQVELEWHSFLLDPSIPRPMTEKKNVYQYLAERKGISLEQSQQMHVGVVAMAEKAGLTYNFDQAIVANSFDAHRMIQLAKQRGLGDAAEEALFRAYFTEGKDFGDPATLVELGTSIGLDAAEIRWALKDDEYAEAVQQDIEVAQAIGVRGVPFFVFNRKYAVSGAQPVPVLLDTLKQSFEEWEMVAKE